MAVKITKVPPQSIADVPVLAPWEDDPNTVPKAAQTLLEALDEFADLPVKHQRKLFIINKSNGTEYRVTSFDSWLRVAGLTGPNNAKLKPRVTERENALYTPIWR
jgi:hypothetical protein